ncbi:hypothetical protein TIFTF001_019001 [Ficus carica]|uniref:Uncharacterized protein n=1 Tax=Ficus carica TaxID=3494 RepID=A0AA88ASH1_FICCA|nr:hypothetical protein TIFTF001_019001 [Ficus carica]
MDAATDEHHNATGGRRRLRIDGGDHMFALIERQMDKLKEMLSLPCIFWPSKVSMEFGWYREESLALSYQTDGNNDPQMPFQRHRLVLPFLSNYSSSILPISAVDYKEMIRGGNSVGSEDTVVIRQKKEPKVWNIYSSLNILSLRHALYPWPLSIVGEEPLRV